MDPDRPTKLGYSRTEPLLKNERPLWTSAIQQHTPAAPTTIAVNEPFQLSKKWLLTCTASPEANFIVNTVFEKETTELRTQNMTHSDLASLKEEDRFMYYSIPGVKRANWEGRSVDLQDVTSSRAVKFRLRLLT
jgi:hypothetical protein